jgi:chromate transport protein ChrA
MEEREASLIDITKAFLKIGAVSYGGPAIMGIMQTGLQERRQWLSKQQFPSIVPLLQRTQDLAWLRTFVRSVGPAVIGALGVALTQMAPAAAPDVFTVAPLVLTVAILMLRNVGPLPLVFGGAVFGVLPKAIPWEQVTKCAR